MKNDRKKMILIVALIILIAIVTMITGIGVYLFNLKPISKEEKIVRIVIPEGASTKNIATILKDKETIRNEFFFCVYVKLNGINNLQAGKYDINCAESVSNIVKHIQNGEIANDEVKLTIIEGKNMNWIASKIAENTNNTVEDVFNLLKDEEYIDSLIKKYWFLTDEIKDERIYYPLEGYIKPDTYIFENEEVSVKTIFNIILNYMEKELNDIKEKIDNTGLTTHQILTLASMAELEGNTKEDRAKIVGVFYNRIKNKMSLGSDVTTYYACKVDMGERNLTKEELSLDNPYNTRGPNMQGKIPVGPICNPSIESIEATIYYTQTDDLYFVADKNGKIYFSKTNDEHNKIINQLKKDGLWYTYEK